ncbi:MAG: hypothetical protein SOV26_03870 [Candidatus Onthovivens sp.]|nr:hypothetical protein [Candidatus Onthovivens sp.]
MNKKTLFIILLIPFLVALLGFTNVFLIKNYTTVDILGITLPYEREGFKLDGSTYKLECKVNVPEGMILSEGNEVYFYIEGESDVASIVQSGEDYYLKPLSEGSVRVYASNKKHTKQASFEAIIYENSAVVISPLPQGSGESVTPTRVFGTKDLKDNKLEDATINFDVKVYSDDPSDTFEIKDYNSNIVSLLKDENNHSLQVKIKENVDFEVSFTLTSKTYSYVEDSYTFNLVKDGINVYSYEDLLYCTNRSENGEIVCLQTSLESRKNTFNDDGTYKQSNVRLFGSSNGFANEVYRFKTTYNDEYIKQIKGENSTYSDVIAGIRVQKDFYGNGYHINGKDLAYPNNGTYNKYSQKLEPGSGDLFKGPRTFVSIGNIDAPIVKAFGQDNSLMYVDGNNITIDNLSIMCADTFADKIGDTTTNNMYNLEYTGSVIDCLGENITIKNCVIKNGRTCLRVYSSPSFTLDNSILSTAREFLMKVGCNEYSKIDTSKTVHFNNRKKLFDGDLQTFLSNHLDSSRPANELSGDEMVENGLFKSEANDYEDLISLQEALDTIALDEGNNLVYGQDISITRSIFHRSGLFSIALDTYFNGCFLYNGMPSFIGNTFNRILPGILTLPDNISGTMLPSKVNIDSKTKFYDYKDISTIDASCLIEERLGDFLSSLGLEAELDIDIDMYFPMKKLLKEAANEKNYIYKEEEKEYVNTPIAFYGGGKNNSIVTFEDSSKIGDDISIDILKNAMFASDENFFVSALSKCVPAAAGFNKFKFITNGVNSSKPEELNKEPSLNELIQTL